MCHESSSREEAARRAVMFAGRNLGAERLLERGRIETLRNQCVKLHRAKSRRSNNACPDCQIERHFRIVWSNARLDRDGAMSDRPDTMMQIRCDGLY